MLLESLFHNVKEKLDGFGVTNGYPLMFESKTISEILSSLKREGKSLRYITEINEKNLKFCKQMLEYIELRHLDKVDGGLIINDCECMFIVQTKGNDNSSSPVFFYSNTSSLINQQQRLFEMMWKEAIPADFKVKQMENGYQRYKDEAIFEITEYDNIHRESSHNIANGLKNPLQSIMGFSKLLLSKTGSIEKYKKYLSIIDNNSHVLSRRIYEVIYFLEIEDKTFRLYRENFDLSELIKNILSTIHYNRDHIARPTYSINSEYKDNGIIINADKQKVKTVLENLILNAVEFSEGKDAEIKIIKDISKKERSEYHEENEIIISITDNGNGIDKALFSDLFSKFVTTSSRGLGLGLYISKNIIEAHGGRIWAQNSDDNGEGATFSFSLPITIENILDKHLSRFNNDQ